MKKNKNIKQTAVEFLFESLSKNNYYRDIGYITESNYMSTNDYIFNKAKQMEKKQHNETWDESRMCDMGDGYLGKQKTFEEYYNEHFRKTFNNATA